MDDEYRIESVDDFQPAQEIIHEGLYRFNVQYVGDARARRVCFGLYDRNREVVGGVTGELYWSWLYVDRLWLREDVRGRGYGQQLLARIEEEARQYGARAVYLDTFSFQAPEFYKRRGYRVFGVLKDFPPGFQRIFLTKEL